MSLIGLTATDLAPLAAAAKTEIDRVIALDSPTPAQITAQQAPGFDPSSVSYCTIKDLFNALQSGYDLGITTYVDLGVHVKVYLNNSALMTPDNMQRLRFLTIDSRIRAVQESNPEYYTASQDIVIPENCYEVLVTFQAAGGASGDSQDDSYYNWAHAGAGGGGGAYVENYSVAVTAGDTIPLVVADTLTFAGLTVEQGGVGEGYTGYSGTVINGGVGGKVKWLGSIVPDDGATVIHGADGSDSGTDPRTNESTLSPSYAASVTTSNGMKNGAGGGYIGGYNSRNHMGGNSGGACALSDSLDGTKADNSGFLKDERVSPIGTGGTSRGSLYSFGSNKAEPRPGGTYSMVRLDFIQQSV